MTMGIVITRYEQFDRAVAQATIGHHFDEPIAAVEIRDLGEGVGLMSSIARAHLTLASGRKTTVVVKCIARTANSELSKGLNFYRNEVNFFRYLANECPIPIPGSLYADVDPVSQDFLLVLKDLGDASSGDQMLGCSEAVLRASFQRAAELHAHFWNRTGEFSWLLYQIDMRSMLFRRDAIFRPGVMPAAERFPHHFTGHRLDLINGITTHYLDLFWNAMRGPQTIVHGDYRVDNMFINETDRGADIIAFDWQNTMGGSGTHDIAYFSSGGCDDNLRGAPEMSALRLYHDVLKDRGVKNYSFDECLDRYRHNLLITMITPIAIAGTLDTGNERGRLLGDVLLGRGFAAIEAFECAELVKAQGARRQ